MKKKLSLVPALVLALSFSLFLLAGCGGSDEGRGDVVDDSAGSGQDYVAGQDSNQQADQGDYEIIMAEDSAGSADDYWNTEATIYDYVGVWEFAASDNWISIYDDFTFTWIYYDGSTYDDECTLSGDGLYLDGVAVVLRLDGDGGLINQYDETLFLSEWPSFEGSDPEEYIEEVDITGFYGVWEFVNVNNWVVIFDTGLYAWIYEDGSREEDFYYLDGEGLVLEGRDVVLFQDGYDLVDQDGLRLFLSELPDYMGDPGDGSY